MDKESKAAAMARYQALRRLVLAVAIGLFCLLLVFGGSPHSELMHERIEAHGIALILIGIGGRLWSILYIGGRKSAEIVATGPYSVVRNPLYFFSLVGGIGIGLVTGSLDLTVATFVVLLVLYLRAIRVEERFLAERYGDEFRSYCARVPRLIPSGRGDVPPDRIEVNARVYAKAFVDAGSYFLLFALLELADVLRAAGALPTLITLR